MPGKGQLLLRGEDTHADGSLVLRGESEGRMKVVSARLVSRASACIRSVLSPRASVKMASMLPSSGSFREDIHERVVERDSGHEAP